MKIAVVNDETSTRHQRPDKRKVPHPVVNQDPNQTHQRLENSIARLAVRRLKNIGGLFRSWLYHLRTPLQDSLGSE